MKKEKESKELTHRQQKKKEKKRAKRLNAQKGRLRQKINAAYERIKMLTKEIYYRAEGRIKSSIRLEIIFIVALSLVLSSIAGLGIKNIAQNAELGERTYKNYDKSRQRLQNNLVGAIQQITNIEQLEISFDVDSERIREIVSTMGASEGAEQLRYSLFEMYAVNGIDENYRYNYYDEYTYNNDYYEGNSQKKLSAANYKELYKELSELLTKGEWIDTRVVEIIEKFLKETVGITESNIKRLEIENVIERINSNDYNTEESQTYIIDNQGNTLYDSSFIKRIDVVQAIQRSQRSGNNRDNNVTSIYPIIIEEQIHYLFNESILRGQIEYYSTGTPTVLGWGVACILFILLMFHFTKSKLRYIEYISHCLGEISKGDLSYEVEVMGKDELAKVALDIAYMEEQIKNQIDAQRQAEKTKNELITNVAHDLRTPLTSIIGYVGLIKDNRFESEEEYEKYLDIAYTKAEKLKGLIEDLFEYTKLNNQAVILKKESMSVTSLINQLVEELMPIAEEKNVTIKTDIKALDTTIEADIPKITRVFENLIENAIKYTEDREVVLIGIEEVGSEVFISIRNRCKNMPNREDVERLFDRFYRSDTSRNSNTGGSGLGLAIAKNIVKLHGGEIWAQIHGDVISFNVKIKK